MTSDKSSPQDARTAVSWNASATDPDNDPILYRFFLNDKPMTNWTTDNNWVWMPNNTDVGSNRVEVQVRDGKHAGPNGLDDRKSVEFNIESIKASNTWQKTFNRSLLSSSQAKSARQTSDGGYIIAGITNNYTPQPDGTSTLVGFNYVWLIKTDSSGNELWNKTLGGLSIYDTVNSFQQTNDGGYIIAGQTYSHAGSGAWDGWLIKTDSSGNELWNKTFGEAEINEANSVQQTSDGGYIIAGRTNSYENGNVGDAWLIKTDSAGNELWDKTFGGSGFNRGEFSPADE